MRSAYPGWLMAALLISAPPAAAQTSKWRLVETQDELTGASDKRLILRAEGWTAGGATLLLVCGGRIAGDAGRTLLLNAGEPLQPFGGDARAYVELSRDGGRSWERHYWALVDGAGARVASADDERGRFPEALLVTLYAAPALIVRYRTLGGDRTARFDLTGLQDELQHLSGCSWPARS